MKQYPSLWPQQAAAAAEELRVHRKNNNRSKKKHSTINCHGVLKLFFSPGWIEGDALMGREMFSDGYRCIRSP